MSRLERKPYNHQLENMTILTETVRHKFNAKRKDKEEWKERDL